MSSVRAIARLAAGAGPPRGPGAPAVSISLGECSADWMARASMLAAMLTRLGRERDAPDASCRGLGPTEQRRTPCEAVLAGRVSSEIEVKLLAGDSSGSRGRFGDDRTTITPRPGSARSVPFCRDSPTISGPGPGRPVCWTPRRCFPWAPRKADDCPASQCHAPTANVRPIPSLLLL